MLQLDLRSGVPICNQIVNGFIRLKGLGVLSGNDQIPSVRALASQLSVNPNTIQKAYAILESNGIIYSVKGKGSFISDDSAACDAVLENARDAVRQALHEAKELGLGRDDILMIVDEEFKKGDKKE